MIETEAQLLAFLEEHKIHYQRMEHPPVYTCEQAEQFLQSGMTGVSTKNLFLSDKAGGFYLVMTGCEKRLALKRLGRQLGTSRLHFACEDKLRKLLGVTTGAVSVLGLINDRDHQVNLLVDEQIWAGEAYLCHPLVNTATLLLSKGDLQKFFELSGHAVRVVPMPAS